MSGLILRLAGPLQSWGEHSVFNNRDTTAFPTRSGLIGLIACAGGRPRTQSLDDLAPLGFTVRVDRPGTRLIDFHTAGGGLPAAATIPTSEGGRRGEGKGTLVSRRHYLADAVFVVAVTGPTELIGRIAADLEQPAWAPYLGRRSCVPAEPLLLRTRVEDPVAELLHTVPLSLHRRPAPETETVPVDFIWEQPPHDGAASTQTHQLADVPHSFAPRHRQYGTRRLWRTVRHLPADLYAGPDVNPLIDYALMEHA